MSQSIAEMLITLIFKWSGDSEKNALSKAKQLKSSLTKILGTIGITLSLKGINQLLEEWNSVNKVVNNLNTNLEDQYAVQNDILEAANNCRLAYSDMANYVNNLVKSGSSFFSTAEDAADFLELTNQLYQVSGATSSEISSLNSVMTTTFTTGKLSASGFSTILSSCPEIVEYLSESLGMSTQNVKALGYAGMITAKQLYTALNGAADEISDAYSDLSLTISDAITIIKNKWGTWLSQLDQTYQITDRIANLMVSAFDAVLGVLEKLTAAFDKLAEFLGSDEAALKAVTAALITLIAALNTTKIKGILTSLKSFGTIFTTLGSKLSSLFSMLKSGTSIAKAFTSVFTNWKVMLVVAAIVAVVAVVRDLIKLLNGEDSTIGNLFEKLGIDSEAFKDSIQGLVDAFKGLFNTILPVLQNLVDAIMPSLKSIAESLLNILTALLDSVIKIIEPIIDVIALIIELVSYVLEPLLEIVSLVIDSVGTQLADAFEFVGVVIDGVINGTLKPMVEFLKYVIEFIKAVFTGDWETVWNALGNIVIAIFNGVISAFESFLNMCIAGINSITSALSSLWSWAGIPEIPEISDVSFSRIAYLAEGGYVEANNPTPVVIGDNTQEGEIVSPISKMRDTMIDALKSFYSTDNGFITDALSYLGSGAQLTASQALESQVSSMNINQNVYMYNTFEGSKDVQKTTSAAMKSSATDLTEALANAIKYTR